MKKNFADNLMGIIGETYRLIEARRSMTDGMQFLDLRDEDAFKNLDSDFATAEEGITKVDVWRSELNEEEFKMYSLEEVKADRRVLGTGNIIYEALSSSNKLGWTELTLADTIRYYGLDEDWKVVKGWVVDVRKWREWFRYLHRFAHGKEKGEKVTAQRQAPNGRTIWACNINEMVYDGVAKEVEINRAISDTVYSMYKDEIALAKRMREALVE